MRTTRGVDGTSGAAAAARIVSRVGRQAAARMARAAVVGIPAAAVRVRARRAGSPALLMKGGRADPGAVPVAASGNKKKRKAT